MSETTPGARHAVRNIFLVLAALLVAGSGFWFARYRAARPAGIPPAVQLPPPDLYSVNGAVAGQGENLIRVRVPKRGESNAYDLKTVNLSSSTEIYSVDLVNGELDYRSVSVSDLQAGAAIAVYSTANPETESVLPAARLETGSYFLPSASNSAPPFVYAGLGVSRDQIPTCIVSVRSDSLSGWTVKGERSYAGSGSVADYIVPVGYYSLSPVNLSGQDAKITIGSIQVSSDFTALCDQGKVLPFDIQYSTAQ